MNTFRINFVRRCTKPLAGLALMVMIAATAYAEPLAAIPFDTVESAAARGSAERQVIVVYFTADWCGWCKRMSSATFTDPRVLKLAGGFAWAKVDTDAQPGIAARFGVRGLPTVMWFNADGVYLGERNGYIAPDAMVELLTAQAGNAEAAGAHQQKMALVETSTAALRQAETDAQVAVAVAKIVETAATQRAGRQPLRQALGDAGPVAWPALIEQLRSERLARRAAAYDLLAEVTGHDAPFDPFAEAEVREAQVAEWRRWYAKHLSQNDSELGQPSATQPATRPAARGTHLPSP